MTKFIVSTLTAVGMVLVTFTASSAHLRADRNWAAVQVLLEEVVSLSRTRGDALAAATGLERYDALLDSYEPELRRAEVDLIFADLKEFLLPLLDRVVGKQSPPLPLSGPFPVAAQRGLCEVAMQQLGFDFTRGRFDVSHHPFCGGVPDDTRITTRYSEAGFLESISGAVHMHRPRYFDPAPSAYSKGEM